VVSTAFIRDFLIGEADIASFSCYSKPPASAGEAFTLLQIGNGMVGKIAEHFVFGSETFGEAVPLPVDS
jgi:hypothetical protein